MTKTNASWEDFLITHQRKWKNMIISWVVRNKGRLLIVKYEDLLDYETRLNKMIHTLKFLNFSTVQNFIRETLNALRLII